MKGNYRERPNQPIVGWGAFQWQEPKIMQDEWGSTQRCWPLAWEAQMWEEVHCSSPCGRPVQWVGVGSPFGDGQEYFVESDAWCYWCFPRKNFTEEELRFVRLAEWARQQTKDEVVEFIRTYAKWSDAESVSPSEVAEDILWLIREPRE